MAAVEIFHNNRCSKSRCALNLLSEKEVDYKVIEYLKDTPNKETIQNLLKKLGIPAQDLIRKGETVYIEKYKGKNLSEAEWIQAMYENPVLIERPIIIKGNKAIIARPPEKVLAFLAE